MNTPTTSLNRNRGSASRALRAVVAGGLLAGTLDIGAAALINMLDPRIILRFIAGGLLGKPALQDGRPVPVLGLFLQWGMSLLIAGVFVFAALRMRPLISRPIRAGLAYGLVVFAVMNYVVMPLSAWEHVNHFTPVKFVENLAAMLLFGPIVAFMTRHSLRTLTRTHTGSHVPALSDAKPDLDISQGVEPMLVNAGGPYLAEIACGSIRRFKDFQPSRKPTVATGRLVVALAHD